MFRILVWGGLRGFLGAATCISRRVLGTVTGDTLSNHNHNSQYLNPKP